MTGTVTGGWPFVIAAYGITVAFLGLYTIGTITRYRRALRQADVPGHRSREAS